MTTLSVLPPTNSMLAAAITALDDAGIARVDPVDTASLLALLRHLYATGRRDLPLGRLLEGHVDAVQIVNRYGDDAQRRALDEALEHGAMLGVWNAGLAGEPLRLHGDRLSGAKAYASGAGVLTHALVAPDTADGTQLLLLPLDRIAPTIDRDWWQTTGMQRSETHIVRWADAAIEPSDRIGTLGDYGREPWLSSGALRFVAVQAGGIAALLDHTRDHLVALDRANDPYQAARLAELFMLAARAGDAIRHTAEDWFEKDGPARLACVTAARLTTADAAERAMTVAREAVGLPGAFLTHPLAATVADLAVYIRQPAPDAQRVRLARAVAERLADPAP